MGSIISENVIITAGHCVYGYSFEKDPKNRKVYAGIHNVKMEHKKPFEHSITKIYIQEDFHDQYLFNDIALVKVHPNFEFNSKVQPVPLALNYDDHFLKGTVVTGQFHTTEFLWSKMLDSKAKEVIRKIFPRENNFPVFCPRSQGARTSAVLLNS